VLGLARFSCGHSLGRRWSSAESWPKVSLTLCRWILLQGLLARQHIGDVAQLVRLHENIVAFFFLSLKHNNVLDQPWGQPSPEQAACQVPRSMMMEFFAPCEV
jgi:hypothetical protein